MSQEFPCKDFDFLIHELVCLGGRDRPALPLRLRCCFFARGHALGNLCQELYNKRPSGQRLIGKQFLYR